MAFLVTGFVLLYMLQYIICLDGYWQQTTSLRNYLPISNPAFNSTLTSNIFACMSFCMMTDGCIFISYITVSSLCLRYDKWIGFQPAASSFIWNLVKDDGCPRGWYNFETSCFLVPNIQWKWIDSVKYCQQLDARLAEVNSQAKDRFLRSVLTTKAGIYKRIWIGGSDREVESRWIWETSRSEIMDGYTNWDTHEPDHDGALDDVDCLCMGKWCRFCWHDCNCYKKGNPLCEKLLL